jgi:hypothetical protein
MARSKNFVAEMPSQLSDLLQAGSDTDAHRKYFTESHVKAIRQLLITWMTKKRNDSIKRTDDVVKLAVPGYAEHQAYQSGYRAALQEVSNLIKLTDQ